MNREQAMLMMLKGAISEMPEDTKARIERAKEDIEKVITYYGEEVASTAMAIRALEAQCKN